MSASVLKIIRVSAPNEVNVSYRPGMDPELWNRRVSAALVEFQAFGVGSPVGTVVDWAGVAAPPGWLICDWRALGRGSHRVLFEVIGVRFGPGDGYSTFNIPTQEQAGAQRPSAEIPTQNISGGAVTTTNPDGTKAGGNVVTGGRPTTPPGRIIGPSLP